ncbi:hypothetical protein FRIGORI9N_270068 [Frigoribacterium sp. 9N]|nr:hypothetical protein FRIGORI9N_270068 [Frigoribacterium sp. 9N]
MGVERRLIRGSDDRRLDLPLLQTKGHLHELRLVVSGTAPPRRHRTSRAAQAGPPDGPDRHPTGRMEPP